MKKLLITHMPVGERELTAIAFFDDFKLLRLEFDSRDPVRIGDVYVGKVSKVVQNIQAAFVTVGDGVECFLPLSDLTNPLFLNRNSRKKALVEGDELLVQVTSEAVKTKAPTVTSRLSFHGKFLVLTMDSQSIGASKKLERQQAEELKALVSEEVAKRESFPFGVILRTNAREAAPEQIRRELEELMDLARGVTEKGLHRTCYSKVLGAPPEHLVAIQNAYTDMVEEIVTDDPLIYQEIQDYLAAHQPEDATKLRFYEDRLLPAYKLYGLVGQLEDALKKQVWLKSGGYLVIEQTEAMVVVDVNTGKLDSRKKDRQETFLKINKEAAKELAHQLILRNLSGMILVDFISMDDKAFEEELVDVLVRELRKDPVRTEFVDVTKLGIVELTRKKQKRSLREEVFR